MLSVKVIFSQRGINFLSQAAHSACGTACVVHPDPQSVELLGLCICKTCLSHGDPQSTTHLHFVLYNFDFNLYCILFQFTLQLVYSIVDSLIVELLMVWVLERKRKLVQVVNHLYFLIKCMKDLFTISDFCYMYKLYSWEILIALTKTRLYSLVFYFCIRGYVNEFQGKYIYFYFSLITPYMNNSIFFYFCLFTGFYSNFTRNKWHFYGQTLLVLRWCEGRQYVIWVFHVFWGYRWLKYLILYKLWGFPWLLFWSLRSSEARNIIFCLCTTLKLKKNVEGLNWHTE